MKRGINAQEISASDNFFFFFNNSLAISNDLQSELSCNRDSLVIDGLAVLHGHVTHQLLHPLLPGVNPVAVQDSSWVQQGYSSVAVQVLKAGAQYGAALLQESAHLCLQSLALADEMSLTCILQKCCCRNITWWTYTQSKGGKKLNRNIIHKHQGCVLSSTEIPTPPTTQNYEGEYQGLWGC